MARRSRRSEERLARIVTASAARPRRVLLLVGILTLVLAAGLPRLTTEVDVLDILPPGDPNTEAARALEARFPSGYSQHVNLDLRTDPGACAAASERLLRQRISPVQCGNITDETYLRATDELARFITAEHDAGRTSFQYVLGVPSIYRLVNWTVAGGEDAPDAAFAMPGRDPEGSARFAAIEAYVWDQVPAFVEPFIGVERNAMDIVLVPAPHEAATYQERGEDAIGLMQRYQDAVANGETTWDLFGAHNPPTFYVELDIGSARSAELARADAAWILPATGAFILAALAWAYRSGRGVAITAATLGVSAVWVFGGMGWLGIPLNGFQLAIAPLLLGIGIDMAIHLTTAFQAARGRDDEQGSDAIAWRMAGRRAGFAMAIATATTVVGLLVLSGAPAPLLRTLAWTSAVAVAIVYLLSVTMLPALVSGTKSGGRLGSAFRPAIGVERMARSMGRHRVLTSGVLVVAVGAGLVAGFAAPVEPFGEFALNLPTDDPYRQAHLENLENFYGTAPGEPLFIGNILVVQGDMVDPAVHDWIRAIAGGLEGRDGVATETLTHLPLLVENYARVRDGAPGAVAFEARATLGPLLGQPPERPDSREEIRSTLDAAAASPMALFGALYVDEPAYSLSVITFSTAIGDRDAVAASWSDVWAAVAAAEPLRPQGTSVGFVGNTATNHLFVEEQLPWVAWLAAASLVAVLGIVGAATRNPATTAATACVVLASQGLWAAILFGLGIGWSLYLVLPLVFITAIGSDHAVHLGTALSRHDGEAAAYGVVGRAIVFGALTDAGALAILALSHDLAVRQTMVASAVGVSVALLATLAVFAVASGKWRDAPME